MFNFKEFNIIEGLKLPVRKLIPIAIVTGVILFLPEELLKKLYLVNFKESWGFIIGIIFLISTTISCVEIVVKIFNGIKEYIYKKKFEQLQPKLLKNLALEEIIIVILLHESFNKTVFLPINNGIIKKLENKTIITKTTLNCAVDITNPQFPYTLNPWVDKLLKDDTEILINYDKIIEENENEVTRIMESLDIYRVNSRQFLR